MPINSTLDVVIQQDDLVVLGPPTSVDISLDIGAQGDPGSQIYVGDFDPNSITISQFTTLYGQAPQGNDLFLRNEVGEYYGVFYSYVNVPGGEQWEPVLEIQEAVELFLNSNSGFILSASAGGTGVNNGTNTFTFTGDINFAGGYDVTFNSSSATNLTLPASGNVAVHQDKLNVFAPTTSAELAAVITDETGTGSLVFGTSPQITTSVTTNSSTFNLINTNATNINFAGAATTLNIGANEAGTTNIRTAATNLTGDLQVGGGDITVTETTLNLANTNATTINFAGAATTLNIGAGTGTTNINNDLVVDGDLTVNGTSTVINSTITTLDDPIITLGGDTVPVADDDKDRGVQFRWHDGTSAKAGFFGFDDSTGRFTFIPDATNTSEVFTGTLGDIEVGDVIADDVAVNGGDLTTTSAIFNLVNTDATTVNFAGAATDIQIGSSSGTTNINNDLDVDGDINIDGGDLNVSASVFNLANANASTVNFAGAATALNIGSSSGLTTINNDLLVSASHYATVDALQLDTTPNVSGAIGRFIWDDGDGTAHITLKGGNVDLPIGQDELALCYNGSGTAMTKGQVVYIAGAQGQRPDIRLASALTETTSSKTFGIVAEPIADGEEGFVITFGVLKGLNTIAYAEGSPIWLSTASGAFTTTMPTQPNHSVFLGYVVRSHASSGQIFVKIQNGYELQELHNVLITSASANDILKYNSASGLWVNTDISTLVNSASVVNAQNINVSGNLDVDGIITGNVTGNLTGNADTATALQTARTISLSGDVSGSASFNGTSDITINATVDTFAAVNSVSGTANEINVSASVGDVVISLPDTINVNVLGNLTGNADTATSLQNSRIIELTGDVSGSASFNGTANASIAAIIQPNSVSLGTDTTGNYVATIAGTTNEIEITGSGSESASVIIGLPDDVTITNDLTVGGNFTVSGSVVYLNVSELLVEDNFITLNSGVTSSPTLDAGIEVERGTDPNVSIKWNETLDQWEFTNDGSTYLALGSGTGDGGFTNHFLMMGA